jgi:hypothetical protein
MGKLKPIGSEKLQGAEKIKRMIEISRYKENIPQSINENTSVEYSITLADGKKYLITKEKVGYVIKKSINESRNEFDYVEPMKNRKYYSSYSEAFKRLNIIAKEINSLTGNKNNISLFTESESSEKRYLLKMREQSPTPEENPEVQPAPSAEVPPTPEGSAPPMEEPMPDETMPDADMESMPDETMPDADMESMPDESVTFKSIQKLTGKLGQKIRQFLSNEENQMSSKDIKYVINSVLSAFDLNLLDEEDRDEIMSKFEVDADSGYDIEDEMGSEPPAEPIDNSEEMPEPEEPVEPETTEGYGYKKSKFEGLTDKESEKIGEMIEGIFSESKVDNILKKYFKIDEKEKKMIADKKRALIENKIKRKKLAEHISKISESISQEISSKRFLSENKDAKFLGKSQLNNIIFEVDKKRYKINTKGDII